MRISNRSFVILLFLVLVFCIPYRNTQSLDTGGQPHWTASDSLTTSLYWDYDIGQNGTANSTHTVSSVYQGDGELLYDMSVYVDESDISFYPAGYGYTETRFDLNSSYYNPNSIFENYLPPATSVSGFEDKNTELLHAESNATRLDLRTLQPGVYYISSFQRFNTTYQWPFDYPFEPVLYELNNVSIIEKYTVTREAITIDGKNYWTLKHERLNQYAEIWTMRVYSTHDWWEYSQRYYNEDHSVLTVDFTRNYYSLQINETMYLQFEQAFLYDKCAWYEEVIGYPLKESDPWYMNYDPIVINSSGMADVPVATLYKNTTVLTFNNEFLFKYTPTITELSTLTETVTDTVTETSETTIEDTITEPITNGGTDQTVTITSENKVTITEHETSVLTSTSLVEQTSVFTETKTDLSFHLLIWFIPIMLGIMIFRRK